VEHTGVTWKSELYSLHPTAEPHVQVEVLVDRNELKKVLGGGKWVGHEIMLRKNKCSGTMAVATMGIGGAPCSVVGCSNPPPTHHESHFIPFSLLTYFLPILE